MRFRWVVILVIVAVAGIAFLQARPILVAYARFFNVDDAMPGADALLVLAGNNLTRVPKAVDLFRKGYAPRLLLTTERPLKMEVAHVLATPLEQANAMARHMAAGAKFEAIPSTIGGARSTFDEAYDLLEYSRANDLRRVIIVTDNYHTRRALHAFMKVLGDQPIRLQVAGAENDNFNELNWWRSDRGLSAYIIEPVKYLVYLFNDGNLESIENN